MCFNGFVEKTTQGGFLFMFNNNNKLVFHKLIVEIGGRFLDNVISKYSGDFRRQNFDKKSHLYSLLYMNIRGYKSLRKLETEASSNEKLKKVINVPIRGLASQTDKNHFKAVRHNMPTF